MKKYNILIFLFFLSFGINSFCMNNSYRVEKRSRSQMESEGGGDQSDKSNQNEENCRGKRQILSIKERAFQEINKLHVKIIKRCKDFLNSDFMKKDHSEDLYSHNIDLIKEKIEEVIEEYKDLSAEDILEGKESIVYGFKALIDECEGCLRGSIDDDIAIEDLEDNNAAKYVFDSNIEYKAILDFGIALEEDIFNSFGYQFIYFYEDNFEDENYGLLEHISGSMVYILENGYTFISAQNHLSRIEFIVNLDFIDLDKKKELLSYMSLSSWFINRELFFDTIFYKEIDFVDFFIFNQICFNFSSELKNIFYDELKKLANIDKEKFEQILKLLISKKENETNNLEKIDWMRILYISILEKNINAIRLLIKNNIITKDIFLKKYRIYDSYEEFSNLTDFVAENDNSENPRRFKLVSPLEAAIYIGDLEIIKYLDFIFPYIFQAIYRNSNNVNQLSYSLINLSIKIVNDLSEEILGSEGIVDGIKFISFIGTVRFSNLNFVQEICQIIKNRSNIGIEGKEEEGNFNCIIDVKKIEKLIKAKMVADYIFKRFQCDDRQGLLEKLDIINSGRNYLLRNLFVNSSLGQEGKEKAENYIISNFCNDPKVIYNVWGFFDYLRKSEFLEKINRLDKIEINIIAKKYLEVIKEIKSCKVEGLNKIFDFLRYAILKNLDIYKNISKGELKNNLENSFFVTRAFLDIFIIDSADMAKDIFEKFDISKITSVLKDIKQITHIDIKIICEGIKSLVDFCIKNGSKIEGPEGQNLGLLFSCCGSDEVRRDEITGAEQWSGVARHLIEKHKANVNGRDITRGSSPLYTACFNGKASAIKALLENGAEKVNIDPTRKKDFLTVLRENKITCSNGLFAKYSQEEKFKREFNQNIVKARDRLYSGYTILPKVFRADCPLCREEFSTDNENVAENRLFFVQCGHSICRACVFKSFLDRKDGKTVQCPSCRSEVLGLEFDSSMYNKDGEPEVKSSKKDDTQKEKVPKEKESEQDDI